MRADAYAVSTELVADRLTRKLELSFSVLMNTGDALSAIETEQSRGASLSNLPYKRWNFGSSNVHEHDHPAHL